MIRALAALLLLSFGVSAWPQSYPTRTVRIIVPYGVGGSADVYGRYLAAKLSDTLGQSVVVERNHSHGRTLAW